MPVATGSNIISPFVNVARNTSVNRLNPDSVPISFPQIFNGSMYYQTEQQGLYDRTAVAFTAQQNNAPTRVYNTLSLVPGVFYSLSVYVKPGLRKTAILQLFRPGSGISYATFSLDGSGTTSMLDNPNVLPEKVASMTTLTDGWYWINFKFKVAASTSYDVSLEFDGATVNFGQIAGYAFGPQLNNDDPPKMLYYTGARGIVTTPRVITAEQTIAAPSSNGRGSVPYRASAEQVIVFPPQAATGKVYPILDAQGASTIGDFSTASAARLVNMLRGVNQIGPFTQEAAAGSPINNVTADQTIGAFAMNVPGDVAFAEAGSILTGQASTARTVPIPSGLPRRTGDAILLFSGAHSDGERSVDMFAPEGYTLISAISGPSHIAGFRHSISVWWKPVSPEDLSAQVVYNLPAEYTNPVVWARATIFRNVGGIESVWAEQFSTPSFSTHDIGLRGPSRASVFFAQSSRNIRQNTPPGNWNSAFDSGSNTGPGFGALLDYYLTPAPGRTIRSTSYNTASPVNTLTVSFAVVPMFSEGHILNEANGQDDLGTFISFQDLKAKANNALPNFTSRGYAGITPITGEQFIAPFTQAATGRTQVSMTANATIIPITGVASAKAIVSASASSTPSFPVMTAGIIQGFAAANCVVDPVTIDGTGTVKISANTVTTIADADSTSTAAVQVKANADQTFGLFLPNVFNAVADQQIKPFEGIASGLHDVATVSIGQNTIRPFDSTAAIGFVPARALTQIAVAMSVPEFTGGSINGFAQADQQFPGFTATSTGTVITRARGESTITPFEQDAGDAIFIRSATQQVPEFPSPLAEGRVGTHAVGEAQIDDFPDQEASGLVTVQGRTVVLFDPVTQGVIVRNKINSLTLAGIDRFSQEASALDPDPKPPTEGGIRISGRFRPFGRVRFGQEYVGRR